MQGLCAVLMRVCVCEVYSMISVRLSLLGEELFSLKPLAQLQISGLMQFCLSLFL